MKAKSQKQRVNVLDSCDAAPIDFSNKEIKELKDLVTEEPRSGKRKPIEKHEEIKDDKKDQLQAEANKEGEEANKDKNKNSDDKDDASNDNTENGQKNGDKEEGDKGAEAKKNKDEPTSLVINNNLPNLIQTYNVNIHGSGNMNTGKPADDNNNKTSQKMKIN